MSAEITYSINLRASKGGISVEGGVSKSKDLAGADMEGLTVATSIAVAALSLGALAQAGTILIKNMDATDSVKIGTDNAMANRFSTIPPGDAIILHSAPTLYHQATANTPRLWITAVED